MTPKTTWQTLLYLLVSMSMCTAHANAQWSQIGSIPGGPIDECFSFTLHGKGYVGGGSDGTGFYQYDTTTNTWTSKGTDPGSKWRGSGFSFVANGHGYTGCGDTTDMDEPCADMWMYNDTTNTWTQKSSFPGGDRDALFAFVINDTAYAGGGFQGGAGMSDFYKYNPFTDTWTTLAALPMGAIGFPVTFVINNKGYVATGQIGASESNDLWEYDPASNAWMAKTGVPGPARQAAIGFAINNYGYVGGGMAGYDTAWTDMWRYDPASNTWASAPPFPSLFAAWSSSFIVGNVAYVGASSFIDATTLTQTDTFRRFRGMPNTTGLGQPAVTKQMELHPNPAKDYVSVTGDIQPGDVVTICDITGKEVKSITGNYSHVNISDLQGGVYILKCVNTTGIFIGKLIVR